MSVRTALIQGLTTAPAPFDDAVLDMLEERVRSRNPEKPEDFAYVVGRNWSIDQARKAERQNRREAARQLKAEEERRKAEVERRSREEFPELYRRLASTLVPTRLRHLQVVLLTCFEGKTDAEVEARFPGTNRDLRYQWKKRGLDLLWPHASAALREFISRGAKKRR